MEKQNRLFAQKVKSKQSSSQIVQSASDFYNLVKNLMPVTDVLVVEKRNIPRNNDLCINAVVPILNISKLYGIKCIPNNRLSLFLNAANPIVQEQTQSDSNEIEIGNWILVNYDSQKYLELNCRCRY